MLTVWQYSHGTQIGHGRNRSHRSAGTNKYTTGETELQSRYGIIIVRTQIWLKSVKQEGC